MKPKTAAPRRRGPNKNPTEQVVAIRFSPDVLDYYRASGDGWQTRMNDDLARLVARRPKGGR